MDSRPICTPELNFRNDLLLHGRDLKCADSLAHMNVNCKRGSLLQVRRRARVRPAPVCQSPASPAGEGRQSPCEAYSWNHAIKKWESWYEKDMSLSNRLARAVARSLRTSVA